MSGRQDNQSLVDKSNPLKSLHASAVIIGEAGILIRGPSGSGKSNLALALLDLARDRGMFACLVGDDRVSVLPSHQRILANGARSVLGLIERRGVGVLTVPVEPRVVLRLVVDLLVQGEQWTRAPEEEDLRIAILGINVARMAFEKGSGSVDRALAVFERLDHLGHKNVFGLAHFA